MKKIKWITALLLCSISSPRLFADQSAGQVTAISYGNRIVTMGKVQYYIPKKIKFNTNHKVKFDIRNLRKGILITVDYQLVKGKHHRVKAIDLLVH
ncbi:MAG: hypothetical protein V7784_17385 [Oceanospirillaceae bacterium]